MVEVNPASKVKQNGRLARAALLASAFLPSTVLAQSTCGVGPAAPYRQNAAQSPQQPNVSSPMVPSIPATLPPAPTVPQFSNPQSPSTALPSAPSIPVQQAALTVPSRGTSTPSAAGTVFSDNFANGIDQSKWGFSYPWSDQCDTNGNTDTTQAAAYVSPNCASQSAAAASVFSTGPDGLGIAIKQAPGGSVAGKSLVTGQLYSKDPVKVGQYVEVTAKMPPGNGLGGAFWLLNTNGAWPPELDVFESIGDKTGSVTQTMHDGTPGNVSNDQVIGYGANNTTTFHTYGMMRNSDKTTFYTDGKATGSFATPASMQGDMYMILSDNASPAGTGSDWHSTIDGSTQFPATFQVQNVRVLNSNPN